MRSGLVVLAMLGAMFGCMFAAQAAPECYLSREIEADQAVQYATELMVVSSTCRTPSYTSFTQRNRKLIIDYQNALIEHYRRSGERRAESAFETYLTHLANETALRTGQEAPQALCTQSASWLSAADAIGPEEFRRLIASRATVRGAAYRRCGD
jgi:hypothetical protein